MEKGGKHAVVIIIIGIIEMNVLRTIMFIEIHE